VLIDYGEILVMEGQADLPRGIQVRNPNRLDDGNSAAPSSGGQIVSVLRRLPLAAAQRQRILPHREALGYAKALRAAF
jgi:hypothetical protein